MVDIILVQLSTVHSITYGHLPTNQKMVFSHTYATQDDDDLLTHIRPHSTLSTQAPQLTHLTGSCSCCRTHYARARGRMGGQWPPPSFTQCRWLVWLLLQGGRERLYGPTASYATDTTRSHCSRPRRSREKTKPNITTLSG